MDCLNISVQMADYICEILQFFICVLYLASFHLYNFPFWNPDIP